uniref:hypothetical protein n=1 Tax=Roseivirga sp. TaxID=1964215 RepID=UPI004047ECCE
MKKKIIFIVLSIFSMTFASYTTKVTSPLIVSDINATGEIDPEYEASIGSLVLSVAVGAVSCGWAGAAWGAYWWAVGEGIDAVLEGEMDISAGGTRPASNELMPDKLSAFVSLSEQALD